MNPFQSTMVQPAFGNMYCLVTWSVLPQYSDAQFFIYRSPTGVELSDDWIILNEDNPVSGVSFYEDTNFTDTSKFRVYYYRILMEHNGTSYDSPVIGTFSEKLTKSQYGALYKMRRMEFLRMRHNGVPVYHCVPSTDGDRSFAYSGYTGGIAGTTCLDAEAFGSWFANGFQTIIQTRAEISAVGPMDLKDDEKGAGIAEIQQFQLRLLGFPVPEVGHIIVLPYSDLRLIIEGGIQPYLFRGFLPVAYDARASQLRKDDPRYKLELPALRADAPHSAFEDVGL
jgi:hypothetical protein